MKCRTCLAVLVIFLCRASARGATIYVTTLEDKVSSTGGCSLKEAIFSANFNDNTRAVVNYYVGTNVPYIVSTPQCVQGSGDNKYHRTARRCCVQIRIRSDVQYDRCSPSLLPFAQRSEAVEFVREHAGQVLTFKDVAIAFAK